MNRTRWSIKTSGRFIKVELKENYNVGVKLYTDGGKKCLQRMFITLLELKNIPLDSPSHIKNGKRTIRITDDKTFTITLFIDKVKKGEISLVPDEVIHINSIFKEIINNTNSV